MDQTIFNWVVAFAGACGGWVLKIIWDAITNLKNDIRQIERDLPEVYVRRDDFKEAVKELKTDMKEGFNKVDNTLALLFKKLDGKESKD
jgi:tetrahydromethanopterin S-methyltransferase subunit G